jgi:hypothetical protein
MTRNASLKRRSDFPIGQDYLRKSCEAPRPQGRASRARSGEPDASKGNFVHIVPLDPAYKAGLAGHVPVKRIIRNCNLKRQLSSITEQALRCGGDSGS